MTEEDKAYWLAWCVEEYAIEKNKSTVEVSQIFEEKKVFESLVENAEILHTQGRAFIIKNIDDILNSRRVNEKRSDL